MKMRYYLRGLGLGILFTAVFFLVGGGSEQTMSDEMVKERAKELGMIENTVLADIPIATTGELTTEEISMEELSSEERTTEERTVEEDTSEVLPEESSEIVEEVTEEEAVLEETKEETKEETVSETEKQTAALENQVISIVVNKGEGSDTVSRHLYEAGLIEDVQAYDKYLMQNGYDRKIGAGEHLIPSGSDWETIAKLLCR